MLTLSSWRRSYALVVVATLAVVAAADFFLYGHTLGWTAAAVVAVMLAAIALRNTRFLRTTGGRVFALATVGLLFALVEEPTTLNITYALVCLGALAMINSSGWEPNFWPWVQRLSKWLVTSWAQVFLDNGLVMRWLVRRGFSPRSARGIAAWIVPVLLSSVFVILFAVANPIIADWLSRLGDWTARLIDSLPDIFNFGRLMFWLAFAAGAWMLLRGRVRRWRNDRATAGEQLVEYRPARMYVPAALVVRCLILFNVVFAVENVLDLRYLYAPSEQMPTGTTYKQYVRRGAYPLVGAALLAGAFVLVTFRPNGEAESSPAARKLVYVWIGQTILLTVSAAWRLEKYVALTELTRLRVASAIWFLLVALGLFYIIWRIVRARSNAWLVNVNALTALIVLYPCCFVNFDGLIADFNAKHCQEAGGEGIALDIEYMRDLGTPALPALDSVRAMMTAESRRKCAEEVADELRAKLTRELDDWHSWTWRRQRSERAAAEVARANSPSRASPQLARATPVNPTH